MWLKQCTAFLAPEPDEVALNTVLEGAPFTPPASLDWFSDGFVPPSRYSDKLVKHSGGISACCLQREDKALTAAVVRSELAKRIAHIESAEARTVGRRERNDIKESIIDTLLPNMPTQRSQTIAAFANGYLLIDATPIKAEHCLARLREVCGGYPAQQLVTKLAPSILMTEWLLSGRADGRFELDCGCKLQSGGDVPAEVNIRRKDLTTPEVVEHVKSGMRVKELDLVWDDALSFTLTDSLHIKRIRWLDVLTEQAEDADDAAHIETTALLLSVRTLSELLDELIALLGGVVR